MLLCSTQQWHKHGTVQEMLCASRHVAAVICLNTMLSLNSQKLELCDRGSEFDWRLQASEMLELPLGYARAYVLLGFGLSQSLLTVHFAWVYLEDMHTHKC